MTTRTRTALAMVLALAFLPFAAALAESSEPTNALAETPTPAESPIVEAPTAEPMALALALADPSIRFVTSDPVCNYDGCCAPEEMENLSCTECQIGACDYDGYCEFDEAHNCTDCMESCNPAGGGSGPQGPCTGPSCPCTPLFDGSGCD